MNEGIHLDLDTWIVPLQIRKANLCRGLGNRYTPAGTEVLISAVAHNTPPPFQAAQNATTVHTRSSVATCTAQRHTPASPECHPVPYIYIIYNNTVIGYGSWIHGFLEV